MLQTPFQTRFELLCDTGQVSQAAVDATLQVIAAIEKRYDHNLTEENAAMFVTHMVMAFERLLRNQELNDVPPEVLDEAAPYRETQSFVAESIGQALEPYRVRVPAAEIAYLTLHLTAIQQADA